MHGIRNEVRAHLQPKRKTHPKITTIQKSQREIKRRETEQGRGNLVIKFRHVKERNNAGTQQIKRHMCVF